MTIRRTSSYRCVNFTAQKQFDVKVIVVGRLIFINDFLLGLAAHCSTHNSNHENIFGHLSDLLAQTNDGSCTRCFGILDHVGHSGLFDLVQSFVKVK